MRVVFFDYWVNGFFHFSAINKELIRKGHKAELLHITSFNNLSPLNEIIDNINCYDIKYYKTKLIYKALEKIKPDLVITLNTTSIMDRAVILAAKKLNIRTIFIMHGVIPLGNQLETLINSDENLNTISFKLTKAKKYLKYYLPNYLYSEFKYDKKKFLKFTWLKVAISHFRSPRYSTYFPVHPYELIQDKCLIYANVFKKYYEEVGYPNTSITVVGNPSYSELFRKIENKDFKISNLPESIANLIKEKHEYAVYVDDGLYVNQIDGWDKNYMKTHLVIIANQCLNMDIKLIVKVRPSTEIDEIYIEHSNLIYVKDLSLFDLVFYAKFCIGHISTALQIPIILNKPIIIPRFLKSKNIPDYYINNNVGKVWLNPEDKINLNIDVDAREK
ncbi:MAG: hypothetical protein ACYC25_00510, partial [Paludibacter sp.]